MNQRKSHFRPYTFLRFVFLSVLLVSALSLTLSAQESIDLDPELDLSPGVPSAPAASSSRTSRTVFPVPLDDKRRLEVADRVSFQILEEDAEPAILPVASSGEISFPLVGRIRAVGRTCKQVASEVEQRLEKRYYRDATVSLALEQETTAPEGKYFVTGQVRSQGAIEIPRGETVTVAQAILHAGGFADFADKRRVRVIRPLGNGEREAYKVDVKAVLEKGDLSKDMLVRPGDYIIVPERMFNL